MLDAELWLQHLAFRSSKGMQGEFELVKELEVHILVYTLQNHVRVRASCVCCCSVCICSSVVTRPLYNNIAHDSIFRITNTHSVYPALLSTMMNLL